jgi:hypothetical protein
MARRSPMNERYQKNTAPAGKTRKSAASAKPKRTSADAPAAPAKKTPAARERVVMNPPTEEFRRWRRIWWILLGGSVAFTLASLAVRSYLQQVTVANVLLFIGYAGIFAALYLDMTKLRRLRKEWTDAQKSGSAKPSKKQSEPADKKAAETKPAEKSAKGDAEGSSADDES